METYIGRYHTTKSYYTHAFILRACTSDRRQEFRSAVGAAGGLKFFSVLFKLQMAKMSKDPDRHMAMLLQQQFDSEFSGEHPGQDLTYSNPKKKKQLKNSSKCLIDPSWELVDPTPNIHILFVQFSQRFFWDKLLAVTVSWSKRMTSCAGICSYQGRGGMCSITLSEPLLKLRPRKDLVETLLHEMIHAYLFVTNNNRDRDGHGPEFHNHMYRINGEAGTNITVYHSFHDEVMLYKQHWWRCEGACQKRPPFFGMVRRAMNRAPGPNDRWWAEHQRNCGGNFIKVKEPEKKSTKKPASGNKENSSNSSNLPDIRNFISGTNSSSNKSTNSTKNTNIQTIKSVKGGGVKNANGTVVINSKTTKPGCKNSDLGVSSVIPNNSNIVGFTNLNAQATASKSTIDAFSGAGKKLSNTSTQPKDINAVKNLWANKFPSTSTKETTTKRKPPTSDSTNAKKAKMPDTYPCPNCNKIINKYELSSHLNFCLNQDQNIINEFSDDDSATFVKCPVCSENIDERLLNDHLDDCLNNINQSNSVPKPTIKVTKPKIIDNANTNNENTGKNKRRSKTPEIIDSNAVQDNVNANKTKKRRSKTPEKMDETSDKESVIKCFETTPKNKKSEQSTDNTATTIRCFTSTGKPQIRSVSMEEIKETSSDSFISIPNSGTKKIRRKSESDNNNTEKTNKKETTRRKSTEKLDSTKDSNSPSSSGFSKSKCHQKYSAEKVDKLAAQEYLAKIYNGKIEDDLDIQPATINSELVQCLVCNLKIDKSNLALHLEDCVGSAFNGEQSEDKEIEENESESEETKTTIEYNCPICMKSIKEEIMNQHIDECLNTAALQNKNFFDD